MTERETGETLQALVVAVQKEKECDGSLAEDSLAQDQCCRDRG